MTWRSTDRGLKRRGWYHYTCTCGTQGRCATGSTRTRMTRRHLKTCPGPITREWRTDRQDGEQSAHERNWSTRLGIPRDSIARQNAHDATREVDA